MAATDVNLFRALKNSDSPGEFHTDGVARDGLLYPRFKATQYTDINGIEQTSVADVSFQHNPASNQDEVQPKGGTSLHNASGWFGHGDYKYFEIPTGTDYPAGLLLHKGKRAKFNKAKTVKAIHYQIEPRNPMTEAAFKGALDTFARNAVVRSVKLATV